MKIKATNLFLSSLLLVAVMVSCNDDNGAQSTQVDTSQNIVELAGESESLSTLVGAIQSAGLTNSLQAEGPFTLLAPTNDAFADLPDGTLENLSNEELTRILSYHVLPGDFSQLQLSQTGVIETLEGEEILIESGTSINGYSDIVSSPIQGSNGKLYTIDAVLLPAGLRDANIVDQANDLGNFTNLVEALETTGLDIDLKFTGDYTVFAPTDAAFSALPSGLLDNLSVGELTEILTYHVLADPVLSTDLSPEQDVTSLSGEDIFIITDMNGVTVNGSSTVETADVEVTNGVIHSIDQVLLPDAFGNVVDAAAKRYFYSSLVDAIGTANLGDVLSDADSSYTVLAPTDDAFAALPAGLLQSLTNQQLAQVLQYHVISGEIFAGDLAEEQAPTSLIGEDIYITVTDDGAFVNNSAEITATDIDVNNGVIHAIDEVILPNAFLNIYQIAQKNYNLESLVAALDSTGLDSDFSGSNPFTLFAPSDEAFAAASDLVETFSATQLETILNYHAAAGTVLSTDLSNGQVITTASGEDITVNIDMDGNVTLNEDSVAVSTVDLEGDNGVIHIVDGVLLNNSLLNVSQIIQRYDELNSTYSALEDAGITDDYTTGNFTFFAPTNEAFEAAADTIEALELTEFQIGQLLTYHSAAGTVLSTDLFDGQTITTELGEDITVSIDGQGVVTLNGSATVTTVDLEGTNGVVHFIDGVLLPPSFTNE